MIHIHLSINRDVKTTSNEETQEDGEAPVWPNSNAGTTFAVVPEAPDVADPPRWFNRYVRILLIIVVFHRH